MQKIAAFLCSIIGLVVTAAPAMPASAEFDQAPPSSSIECTDYQSGFGTAPGEDGATQAAPPAVTPAVTPEVAQSPDPDPVDLTKAEIPDTSELKPPIDAPAAAPKPVAPSAVVPGEPKPAVTVHEQKDVQEQPEVVEAPAAVPTNKARRHWFSGFGTGIITNTVQAMVQAPRAICQYTASEYHSGVADMTDNGKNSWLKAPASIISVPFSIGAGIAAGTAEAFTYQEVAGDSPKLAESTKKSTQ